MEIQCSDVCEQWKLGDSFCDSQCNNPICNFDNGDCVPCAEGCHYWKIGDKMCHDDCNNELCGFDGGDCLVSHSCEEAISRCTGEIEDGLDESEMSAACGFAWEEALGACGNSSQPEYQDLQRGFSSVSQCYKYHALNIDSRNRHAQLLYDHALEMCAAQLDGDANEMDLAESDDDASTVMTAYIDGNHTFNGGGTFHLEFQYSHNYLAYWEEVQRGADIMTFCGESDRATKCATPFIYGNQLYNGCTDMSDGYRPWCALMVDEDRECGGKCTEKGVEWDYCAPCSSVNGPQNSSTPLSISLGSGYLSFQFENRAPLVEDSIPLSYDVKLTGCEVGAMSSFTAAYDRFIALGCWDSQGGATFPCSGECFAAFCDLADRFVEGPPPNCGWIDVCKETHQNGTFVQTFCQFLDRSYPASLGLYADQCAAQTMVEKSSAENTVSLSSVCPSGLSTNNILDLVPLKGPTVPSYRLGIVGTSLSVHGLLSIGLGNGVVLTGTVTNPIGGIEGELIGNGKSFVLVQPPSPSDEAVILARRESALILPGSDYVRVLATGVDLEQTMDNFSGGGRRAQSEDVMVNGGFEYGEEGCTTLCLRTLHCVGYTFHIDVLNALGENCWLLVRRTASPTASPTFLPTPSPTSAPTSSSCTDGILNGDETAVDCGGSCRKCDMGQSCLVDSDCNNGKCSEVQGSLVCSTYAPTIVPTSRPTLIPTSVPTTVPTESPTKSPSTSPTYSPSNFPSSNPSMSPTAFPSQVPTGNPTPSPPTPEPTVEPTRKPTTAKPTIEPTSVPTDLPSMTPTSTPAPTASPTTPSPTFSPTLSPTPPTPLPTAAPIPPCSVTTLASLDFFGSSLEYSNLGGVGPDYGFPEEVFYSNVGAFEGESFDLKVQLASGTFSANQFGDPDADFSEYIGVSGKFGQLINAPEGPAGRTTHYTFTFLKDGLPLSLNYFHFSFFDLDRGNGIQEEWCVNDNQYASWSTGQGDFKGTDDMDIVLQNVTCDGGAGSSTRFVALKSGDGGDNPSDPLQLGIVENQNGDIVDQRDRSVAFFFRGRSSFDFTWTTRCIETTLSCTSVRGLNFAGESTITNGCDDTPNPTPIPSQGPITESLSKSRSPTTTPSPSQSQSPTATPLQQVGCGCSEYQNNATPNDEVVCVSNTDLICRPLNPGDGLCPGDHLRCEQWIDPTRAPSATTSVPTSAPIELCVAPPLISCGPSHYNSTSSLEIVIGDQTDEWFNLEDVQVCVTELCESDRTADSAGGGFGGDEYNTKDRPEASEFDGRKQSCQAVSMLSHFFTGHLSGDSCWYQAYTRAISTNQNVTTECESEREYQLCSVNEYTFSPTANVEPTMSPTYVLCTDTCHSQYLNDGDCDDGGVGSSFDVCAFGTDCSDCGERFEGDPLADPNALCFDECQYIQDGVCDDGGEGSEYNSCSFGYDCSDCGVRDRNEERTRALQKTQRRGQEVTFETMLDSTRWELAMQDALCDWEETQEELVRNDMISRLECLELCDQDPLCSGWVMWNASGANCIIQRTPCERWSSPGAFPGWSIWIDWSRVRGWVREGAIGFSSAIDVELVDAFESQIDMELNFVTPSCPRGLIGEISEHCARQCPQQFLNHTSSSDEDFFHCLCARCDFSFILDLCATSPACGSLSACADASALYASLSTNYTCDSFAVVREPCPRHWIGNGFCDEECNAVEYDYDEGDCLQCAPGCHQHYIGDFICDEQCNTRLCNFDGGDCGGAEQCSPGCFDTYLGDNFCDANCNTEACNFDNGDCLTRCAEECENAFLGDSYCDRSCNVFECNYDLGDCNQCSDGCPFSWLADGVCDAPCQTEACNYDFGDCPGIVVNGSLVPPEEGPNLSDQCNSIYVKLTKLTLRIGNMQLQEDYLANAILEVEEALADVESQRAELEVERDELEELYSQLDEDYALLQIERDDLELLAQALANQTAILEMQRANLEAERNALQLERDALEAERNALQEDKIILVREQRQLEEDKAEVEDQRDSYLTNWVLTGVLVLLLALNLVAICLVRRQLRKKGKSAYDDFKAGLLSEENESEQMMDLDDEAEQNPCDKVLDVKPPIGEMAPEGSRGKKPNAAAPRLPFHQNRVVPTVECPPSEENGNSMDASSPFVNVETTIETAREKNEGLGTGKPPIVDATLVEWERGRGKLPGIDSDEIEDVLELISDDDTAERQQEMREKLKDVQTNVRLEEEMKNDMGNIEEAVSNEGEILQGKLEKAIEDKNVVEHGEIFEEVGRDLAKLRDAHELEMRELEDQLKNNALANEELLQLRLKRRRAMRDKALRDAGANEEQIAVVMNEFDNHEKAAVEQQKAIQDALSEKVHAVVTPPADCMTDVTVVQSEADLRKQFKTDKSTLENLKNNEKGRLEENLQKKLLLRQKKRRAELERQALEEKEARLQKEIEAEKQKVSNKYNPAKLERVDSMREFQTLEDMQIQHEEEVGKLEAMVLQQNARQNDRLEERLERRRQARQRQLKQAKVPKKEIKRDAKKQKKLEEAAREEMEKENAAVNKELVQTSQILEESPEVTTNEEFQKLLELSTVRDAHSSEMKELRDRLNNGSLAHDERLQQRLRQRRAMREKELMDAGASEEVLKVALKDFEVDELSKLQSAHASEMKKLQDQRENSALADDERLQQRLKKRRALRERELRDSGKNKKEIDDALKVFDEDEISKLQDIHNEEMKELHAQRQNNSLANDERLKQRLKQRKALREKELRDAGASEEIVQVAMKNFDDDINTTVEQLSSPRARGMAASDKIRALWVKAGRAVIEPLRQSRLSSSSESKIDWQLDALEKAKQQALELEKKKQELLLATKKEHENDISFLENQLQEEMDLKKSQLQARLEKRQQKRRRDAAKAAALAGPPVGIIESPVKVIESPVKGSTLKSKSPGYGQKLVLSPIVKDKKDVIADAEADFEAEISKLKEDFKSKREAILEEQKARLEEDAKIANVHVEQQAVDAVERAQKMQENAAMELDTIISTHKKETEKLQNEMDAQQKRVDEKLQARLAKRRKTHALAQSQPDDVRLKRGPIRDSWTENIQMDPEIVKMQDDLKQKQKNLAVLKKEQEEREREQKRLLQAAHAEALAAATAYNTFKEKVLKDERRAHLVKTRGSQRSGLGSSMGSMAFDEETPASTPMKKPDTREEQNIPGTLNTEDSVTRLVVKPKSAAREGSVTNVTAFAESTKPHATPKTVRGVLRMLIKFEGHKFTEDECLVLEEFSRQARKNLKT